MKQALHIFKKDVRHQWIGIAVIVVLVIMQAHYEVLSWTEPNGGTAYSGFSIFMVGRFLSGLIWVLLPAAWTIVLLRVVHDESLVGDRQFWVTRPYQWKDLLAAKILFVLVFISVPCLFLQFYLLHAAGFSIHSRLVGLLGMQLGNLVVIVPLLALASLTSTLAQVVLALVAIILYFIGASYLSSLIKSSSFSGASDSLEFLMFMTVCVCVILLQYARRAWWRSATIVSGLAVAVLITVVVWPYGSVVRSEYPVLHDRGISLSLQPPVKPPENVEIPVDNTSKEVEIQLPFAAFGIAPPSILRLHGWRVALDFPDGSQWDSGWEGSGGVLFPDRNRTAVSFNLKRALFERWKSSAVKARVSLALSGYEERNVRTFTTPEDPFDLEGASCEANREFSRTIQCLAAFRRPSFLVVREDLTRMTCPLPPQVQSAPKPGDQAVGYVESSDPGLITPGFSPVERIDISLYGWDWSNKLVPTPLYSGVCPGTPLTLSDAELSYQGQVSVELPRVKLSDYQLRSYVYASVRAVAR